MVLLMSVIPLSSPTCLARNKVECFHLALIFFLAVRYQKATLIILPPLFPTKSLSHVMTTFSSAGNCKSIKETVEKSKRVFLILLK